MATNMNNISNFHDAVAKLGVPEKDIQDLIYFIKSADNPNGHLYVSRDGHIYSKRDFFTKTFDTSIEKSKEIETKAYQVFKEIMERSVQDPSIKPSVAEYLDQLAKQLSQASSKDTREKAQLFMWVQETRKSWAIEQEKSLIMERSVQNPSIKPSAAEYLDQLAKQLKDNLPLQNCKIQEVLKTSFDCVKKNHNIEFIMLLTITPYASFPRDIINLLGEAPTPETLKSAARITCEFCKTVGTLDSLENIRDSYKIHIKNSLKTYARTAEHAIEKHKKGKETLTQVFSNAGTPLPSA